MQLSTAILGHTSSFSGICIPAYTPTLLIIIHIYIYLFIFTYFRDISLFQHLSNLLEAYFLPSLLKPPTSALFSLLADTSFIDRTATIQRKVSVSHQICTYITVTTLSVNIPNKGQIHPLLPTLKHYFSSSLSCILNFSLLTGSFLLAHKHTETCSYHHKNKTNHNTGKQ